MSPPLTPGFFPGKFWGSLFSTNSVMFLGPGKFPKTEDGRSGILDEVLRNTFPYPVMSKESSFIRFRYNNVFRMF